MKQVNIVISNGHMNPGNGQTGTSGERDLIEKVYYALAPLLIKAGLVVYYDDANLTNIKSLGDNLMYAIFPHFDGSTNPTYNGGFVDDSPTDAVATESWKLAGVVADSYFGPMGIRFAPEHRTINSTQYYAFNYTGANTKQFLIELGTLTNVDDRAKCQDFNKIATLLARGIIQYLTFNDATYKAWLGGQTPPVPVPPPIPDTAQIDELRKQLQTQKDLVVTITKEKNQLAADFTECQRLNTSMLERLTKIKTFILTA